MEHGARVLGGATVTIELMILSFSVAVLIAVVMGLMKLSPNAFMRGTATVCIDIFRRTSLLAQLFWIFCVSLLSGVTLQKFTAGFLAVGMNLSAYGAEIVRGAVQSVPRGQCEAALALDMPPMKRMRVTILPPWGNLLIELLKGTALVALISVTDLMFEARQINGSTVLSAETFGTALVLYYVMARFGVTPLKRWLEGCAA
ncbi:MAG: amino acid ABC transporter permease [Pseudomonadota bacterium]